MNLVSFLLAQTTQPAATPTTGPAGQPPPQWFRIFGDFGWIILILVIFWFMMMRGKQKQERQRRSMLNSLKKGDEVQTIGGVLGKVIEAREDRVLLKVDESSNAKMWFTRSAIARVVSEEKAESK